MHRDYVAWDSPSLGRRMEILWFGFSGRPLLIFPTAVSRFYESEDFGIVGALRDKIDRGEVQLCCVDTVNTESWYNNSVHPLVRVARHEQYDSYLKNEVAPMVRDRAKRDDLAVYGASFGAYHAMNFACRYPEIVKRAICFSGIYDVHRFLDGHWSDACYFHCPTAYVPNLNGEWSERLKRVEFVIATGEQDTLVNVNREFIGILQAKAVPVHGEIWPGVFGHDWPYWRENLPRFIP